MPTAHLYVLDTLADWEPGYATAELNSGRFFAADQPAWTVKTIGLRPSPVITVGGVRIAPDGTVDAAQADPPDLLILPGGDTWLEPIHKPVLDLARTMLADGRVVAAICGATIGLAEAGLLDDRPHTSNDLGALQGACPSYAGAAHYRHDPAVIDGDLITASGVAPVQFAAAIFERLGVMTTETITAWRTLYETRDPTAFGALMASLPPQPSS